MNYATEFGVDLSSNSLRRSSLPENLEASTLPEVIFLARLNSIHTEFFFSLLVRKKKSEIILWHSSSRIPPVEGISPSSRSSVSA